MASRDRGLKEDVFGALRQKYPQHANLINTVEKLSESAARLCKAAAPHISRLLEGTSAALQTAEQYEMQSVAPMLIGLAVCFFGGYFLTVIMVLETLRLLCWEDIRSSFQKLRANYEVAQAESRRDDEVDADGNGIADVKEMEKGELLAHKVSLFLKSVNMQEVRAALRVLANAGLSVVATLRVRLARNMALAGSVADAVGRSFPQLAEHVAEFLPTDRKKFAGAITSAALQAVAFVFAVLFNAAITTANCALRGAQLFTRHALELAKAHGLLPRGGDAEITLESDKGKMLVGGIAVLGLLFQMLHRTAPPFPLSLLLLPLTLAESILGGFVALLSAAPLPAQIA